MSAVKKDVTKLKIVDEHGVVWVPIQNMACSSALSFTMSAFGGAGIIGEGNNQTLEVIVPNKISGDRTYKYLIAVDGKNYDEEVYVTVAVPVAVPDDHSHGKSDLSTEFIRDMKVKYLDESGTGIKEEETVKVYTWTKAYAFGIRAKDIDNHSIKAFKMVKYVDGQREEYASENISEFFDMIVNDYTEIEFIYKKNVVANSYISMGSTAASSGYSVIRRAAKRKDVKKEIKSVLYDMPGTWEKDDKGWWIKKDMADYVKNSRVKYSNKWYYINAEGYMHTGWIEWEGKWYYLNAEGDMLSGTTSPDGYTLGADGAWIK